MAGGMGNRPAGAGPQPKRKVTAFERHKAEREEKRLRKYFIYQIRRYAIAIFDTMANPV